MTGMAVALGSVVVVVPASRTESSSRERRDAAAKDRDGWNLKMPLRVQSKRVATGKSRTRLPVDAHGRIMEGHPVQKTVYEYNSVARVNGSCQRKSRGPSALHWTHRSGFSSSTTREKTSAPRLVVQATATTVLSESPVGSDQAVAAAVEEVMTLARAAAKAAREAAAASAEAQAMRDSYYDFPSEQDLLLLERARLNEMMARSGAVESLNPTKALSLTETKEMESRLREVDLGHDLGSSSTEKELDEGSLHEGSTKDLFRESRGDSRIVVRSKRRKERILKRERAMVKADVAAAALSATSSSRSKKSELSFESSDPVRAYLRDIGKSKLLTSAEEVELAEGIQDLLKIEAVKAELTEQLGHEPTLLEWARAVGTGTHSLESRIKSGQACKDKMVNSNLRLVVSIAKRYQGRGMTIQDLIQEGSVGLIRGAEKYDHTRGFKFSTYAHWWIRQAITRAIADQSRTIRLPVHVYELLCRITKAKSMLAAEHGRTPRDEEVAELVGLTIEKLRLVIKSAKTPRSMEFPVGKNNDTTLGEVIPDRKMETPEEAISKRLLKQDLDVVLHTLSPRERDVLRLRYGLGDGRMRTLEEIGNVFRVTRERIRQIEAKALRKLRQPSRNEALRNYLF